MNLNSDFQHPKKQNWELDMTIRPQAMKHGSLINRPDFGSNEMDIPKKVIRIYSDFSSPSGHGSQKKSDFVNRPQSSLNENDIP